MTPPGIPEQVRAASYRHNNFFLGEHDGYYWFVVDGECIGYPNEYYT